jgi:hypothetical protein
MKLHIICPPPLHETKSTTPKADHDVCFGPDDQSVIQKMEDNYRDMRKSYLLSDV